MPLQYSAHSRVDLKKSEFTEKWVQDRIAANPAILGMGNDVRLLIKEKKQPKAGPLDLLLYDEELNRRYEVELMLGATDPSHIMRCIEYWDIERRRYPGYDHVAVLIAEDITARFLNVISLLSGTIPIIALQMSALQIEEKVILHFAKVLDQTALREDDEKVQVVGGSGDRVYWQKRVGDKILGICDQVLAQINKLAQPPMTLNYRNKFIDVYASGSFSYLAWFIPSKAYIDVGVYCSNPTDWVHRFAELGLQSSLRRANRAARVRCTPEEFVKHQAVVYELIDQSTNEYLGNGQV